MSGTLQIGNRVIGPGAKTYLVAELSANHGQSLEKARELIHAAHEAGADAVKLQTYTADSLTIDCDQPQFQIGAGTIWQGRRLYELYREAATPWKWHAELQQLACSLDLDFFSTPFDLAAIEFLENLDVPAYKIASFEIVDIPLVRAVAQTGKPVIMSTGMSSLSEIDLAVQTIRGEGTEDIALLKCTSAYPAPPESMNLRTIPHLADSFGVVAGLSDHTLGIAVPVASVAVGACIIEKHLTLSRDDPGPDSQFSLEPAEFADLVRGVRIADQAMGQVAYGPDPHERPTRSFRRSLFVVRDIKQGEPINEENVRSIRPGDGLEPRHWDAIVGRTASADLRRGTPLAWHHVA